MNKILLASTLFIASHSASAVVNCIGEVGKILDWNVQCIQPTVEGYQASRLAFTLEGTNGTNGRWICSTSEKTDALLMLAYANKNLITARLPSNACSAAGHYTVPQYIIAN